MSKAVGIDLGTSKSAIAYITGKNTPAIIENLDGEGWTPSLVYYDGSGEFHTGKAALNLGLKDPKNLVYATKNSLGRDYTDPVFKVLREHQRLPFNCEKDHNGEVIICIGKRYFSPPEILAFFIESLQPNSEVSKQDRFTHAVIASPAYFGQRQREALHQAGHLAGLNVLQLLNESIASALAYQVDADLSNPQTALVFDLGAGALSASVMGISASELNELGTSSDMNLGGDAFDYRIVDELVRVIQEQHQVDVRTLPNSEEILLTLKFQAESAKIRLGKSLRTQIVIPGLALGGKQLIDFEYELNRETFNNLIRELVQRSTEVINDAIHKAQKTLDDIDTIILVGRSLNIPLVQEELRGLFGNKVSRQIIHPTLCVAQGAAIQTSLIKPAEYENQPDPSIVRCEKCGTYNLKNRADCRRCGAIIPPTAVIFNPGGIALPTIEVLETGKQGGKRVEGNIPTPVSSSPASALPGVTAFQRLKAAALIKTGSLEQAHKLLSQVGDAVLWMWLGKAYADKGQLSQAAQVYGEAVKLEPHNKDAVEAQISLLHKIAIQHAQKKEWRLAGELLRQAVELDPKNQSVRNLLDAVEILGLTSDLDIKQLESGIPVLEKIQAKDFTRADVAHQLAIFYHRKAIADEDIANHKNGEIWEKAFANWALMLNNPAYWQRWMQSRHKAYEHDLTDTELKVIRQQTIPDMIKKLHGQYITAYGKADQIAGVNRHKQYQARLSLELSAARNLEEVLSFLSKSKRPAKIPVACGPIMWQQFQLIPAVEATARAALALDAAFEPAQKVLDAIKSTALIRAYLSEGLLDEAIAMLEKEFSEGHDDQSTRELLQKAYLEKLKTLTNMPLKEAKKIFDKARKYGLNTSEMEVEYAQQVLVKADQAQTKGKLEEADKILRDALTIAGRNQNLKDKLASVTNRRVVEMVEEGRKKDPNNEIYYLDKGSEMIQEVDKLIGPNHPTLMENLAAIKRLQAVHYNEKAKKLVESAASAFQSGFRSNGISYLKQARDALRIAVKLNPSDNTIQENLVFVEGLLRQAGIY